MRLFYFVILFVTAFATAKESALYQANGLEIYPNRALYQGKTIYDGKAEASELIAKEKELEPPDECTFYYTFDYTPLSLVGNYYSYAYFEGGEFPCGASGNGVGVHTIDLTTFNKVPITDLFNEDSLLSALKSDTWITQFGKDTNTDFSNIESFTTFLQTLNQATFDPNTFVADAFTIVNYDKTTNQAAVRFVGEKYVGFNHNEHLQLGLLLTPTPAFQALLENKFYFKLGDYSNSLAP